jgi:cytochrome c7-like protein
MKVIILSLCAALSLAVMANAVQNKGAEHIELFGGKTGKVLFPHHKHQTALGDCNLCHDIFPQKSGSIEQLKTEESLKKKQVMNKQCIKCHRSKKKAGERSGPLKCKECHRK